VSIPERIAIEPLSTLSRDALSRARSKLFIIELLLLLGLSVVGLWNLDGAAVWWDEGWTLSVARSWVEHGNYGRLLDGQLAPPGLQAAFPVTAPIALSMRLFGVGIWQGRIFGVLCMLVALALIYYLALRLYSQPIALGTLAVLLLTPMHPFMHPLLMGRQVLAEMPMLAYLLGGYTCLLLALQRSRWFLIPAILLGGIGLVSKLQAVPFWTLSLLIPLGATLLQRRWRIVVALAALLVGSFCVSQLVGWFQAWLLQGHTLLAQPLTGLLEVTAFVPVLASRRLALFHLIAFGWLALLGFGFALWRWWHRRHIVARDDLETIRLVLLSFTGTWMAWFIVLSVGWPRYLFPPIFVGSMFTSALLCELTDHFNMRLLLTRASTALRQRRFTGQYGGALLAVLIIAATTPLTLRTVYRGYLVETSDGLFQVAHFLNAQTPPDALIETYESELHFMLERRYHYPPDQLHIELARRTYLEQNVTIDYDPLAANPDYLVVGKIGRTWWLYQPVVEHGDFRLIETYGEYEIYRRVRQSSG
jgi:4-amino-4-deoxy-L-arabinose transferase-like glycosyltransferase